MSAWWLAALFAVPTMILLAMFLVLYWLAKTEEEEDEYD